MNFEYYTSRTVVLVRLPLPSQMLRLSEPYSGRLDIDDGAMVK